MSDATNVEFLRMLDAIRSMPSEARAQGLEAAARGTASAIHAALDSSLAARIGSLDGVHEVAEDPEVRAAELVFARTLIRVVFRHVKSPEPP